MKREWSLAAARAVLPDVRSRTERTVDAVEELVEQRDRHPASSEVARDLERRIRDRVSLWVREMEALGLETRGLWLVDFDNGAGYYCWRWPEEGLDFFHGYDEGFAGRRRIQ
ncbi:MAG: DUF2203 family protein [Myxococcota bacterium]